MQDGTTHDDALGAVIWRLVGDATGAGLCLDFDGTLSAIVDDPRESRLAAGVADVLDDLTGRLGTVAVVSGRPAAFLAERVPVPGARLLGLYGLQEWTDGGARPRPEAAEWAAAVADARDDVRQALRGLDGVYVEDKGLSVAVHWRNASDRAAAEREVDLVLGALAAETGLQREPGKLVAELRPPVEWDKGACVHALVTELDLTTVVYVGDDLGDLVAFEAAHAHGGIAVAVDHGAETPAALLEAADAVLAGTDAVAAWLNRLRDDLAR